MSLIRHELDDEIVIENVRILNLERMNDDALHLSVVDQDGTLYGIDLGAETPITWGTWIEEPREDA